MALNSWYCFHISAKISSNFVQISVFTKALKNASSKCMKRFVCINYAYETFFQVRCVLFFQEVRDFARMSVLTHKRLGTAQISMLKLRLFLPQNRIGIMRKEWGKSFREEGTSSELRTSALLLIFCLHQCPSL